MTRLDAVLSAHVTAAYDAVTAAGITTTIPSPMVNGWTDAGELGSVARGGGYVLDVVAVEPSGPSPRTTRPARLVPKPAANGLTVTALTRTSFELGGVIVAGNALHVIVRNAAGVEVDRYVVVAATDTLATLAARVSQQFSAVMDADVTFSVTANGATIGVSGAAATVVKPVLAASALRRKAQRVQRVQITLWTSSKALRANVPEAIVNAIGTDESEDVWLPLGDGTFCVTRYVSGPRRTNENLETDSLLRADLFFNARYDLVVPLRLTPIVAITATATSGQSTNEQLIGGP